MQVARAVHVQVMYAPVWDVADSFRGDWHCKVAITTVCGCLVFVVVFGVCGVVAFVVFYVAFSVCVLRMTHVFLHIGFHRGPLSTCARYPWLLPASDWEEGVLEHHPLRFFRDGV